MAIEECPEKAISEGAADAMEKSGVVVGVCVSQRKTDSKKNVGRGFLRN